MTHPSQSRRVGAVTITPIAVRAHACRSHFSARLLMRRRFGHAPTVWSRSRTRHLGPWSVTRSTARIRRAMPACGWHRWRSLPATRSRPARSPPTIRRPGSRSNGRRARPGTRPASTLVPVTQGRDWRVYDWPARHAAAVALMKERQPEIVMLGDSIIHFWGGDPSGEGVAGRRTAPEVWDRFFTGRRVVNLGYGWDRTENVLWRLRHGEFENVSPRVVVVMIGTNNITLNTPDEIAAGVSAICDEIHQRSPATRILLLGIFPRGEKPDANRATVEAVNHRLAAFEGRGGVVTYLDIGDKFLGPDRSISKEIMYDFLHPTAKGYAIWAAAMEPTLTRLTTQ